MATVAAIVAWALGWAAAGPPAGAAAEAQFRNLAYVYPRGESCVVRLSVTGADEVAEATTWAG